MRLCTVSCTACNGMCTLQVGPPNLDGVKLEGKSVGEAVQHGQASSLAAPAFGPCASSEGALWLWAALHSRREGPGVRAPSHCLGSSS